MLSVSLRSIGVMSPGRMWLTVLMLVGAFVAVGAGLAYFLGGANEEPVVVGSANADDPFLIGAAEEVDVNIAEATPDAGAGTEPAPAGESAENVEPAPTADRARGRIRPSGRPADPWASRNRPGSGERGRTTIEPGRSDQPPVRDTPLPSEEVAREGGEPTNSPAGESASAEGGTEETAAGPGEGMAPGDDVPEERDLAMSLYTSQVRFVVRRYYQQRARSCFDRATRNNPTLSGTVVVGLTIGTGGNVVGSTITRNSTGDSALGACLANQARTWRLPAPPEAPLTLQLPFSR